MSDSPHQGSQTPGSAPAPPQSLRLSTHRNQLSLPGRQDHLQITEKHQASACCCFYSSQGNTWQRLKGALLPYFATNAMIRYKEKVPTPACPNLQALHIILTPVPLLRKSPPPRTSSQSPPSALHPMFWILRATALLWGCQNGCT